MFVTNYIVTLNLSLYKNSSCWLTWLSCRLIFTVTRIVWLLKMKFWRVSHILLIGNNVPELQSVKSWLGKCFAMKDLEEAAYILGIRIYRDLSRRLIGLSQSTYGGQGILKRFNMENSKKGNVPMHHSVKLSKSQCPNSSDEHDKMSRVP